MPSSDPSRNEESLYDAGRRALRNPAVLLFLALIALQLISVWAFRYFPAQDGRAHLYNSELLRLYQAPGLERVREFFQLNLNPWPNWFDHVVLAALLYAVPPLVAEKILASGYLILLPLSAVYALRSLRPGTEFVAFAVLTLSQNFLLYMGFYNFLYSVAAFFLVLGYWAAHRDRFGAKESFELGFLGLFCYFCHVFSLVMALVFIGCLTMGFGIEEYLRDAPSDERSTRRLLRIASRRILGPAVAFAPTVALTVWFVRTEQAEPVARADLSWRFTPVNHLICWLPTNRWQDLALGLGMMTVLLWIVLELLLARLFHRRFHPQDGFFLSLLICQVTYLLVPGEVSGGGFVLPRFSLFILLTGFLWVTAAEDPLHFRKPIVATSALIVVLSVLSGLPWRAHADRYLSEYNSAETVIEPGSTMLSLRFSDTGDLRDSALEHLLFSPFVHAADLIALRKHAVLLDNYELRYDYFPLVFRPDKNPYSFLNSWDDIENTPGRIEVVAYGEQTGQPIDYVLIWGERQEDREDDDFQFLYSQLDAAYERIFLSPPAGLLQVYRRKGFGARVRSSPKTRQER